MNPYLEQACKEHYNEIFYILNAKFCNENLTEQFLNEYLVVKQNLWIIQYANSLKIRKQFWNLLEQTLYVKSLTLEEFEYSEIPPHCFIYCIFSVLILPTLTLPFTVILTILNNHLKKNKEMICTLIIEESIYVGFVIVYGILVYVFLGMSLLRICEFHSVMNSNEILITILIMLFIHGFSFYVSLPISR